MANEQNLIPLTERTEEEAKEIRSKGGKTTAKNAQRRKSMQEDLDIILNLLMTNKKIINSPDEIKSLADLKGVNLTVQQAILLGQIEKAVKQKDTQSAIYIRDTSGNKPKEEVSLGIDKSNKFDDIVGQIGGEGIGE